MALIGSLFLSNLDSLLQDLGTRPLPDIMKDAIRESRYQAALNKETIYLTFDEELSTFSIRNTQGIELISFESGYAPRENLVNIQFYQILPQKGLHPGSRRSEESKIDAVRFRPDRSSTPFVVELKLEGETSRHRFDPFSDLEIADAR